VEDKVTIVMATRNGAAHLVQQLESLAAQSHSNWALFVSDDGSTDGTRAILADFARHHPVTLVEGPRRGAAANFISALCHPDLSPGWIALADQDDVWLDGKLARGLRRLRAAQAGRGRLYAAESALTDPGLNIFRISSAGSALPGFAASLAQNLFGGHTMMFDADALGILRQAGVPQDVAFHDWWIYQLLAGAGAELVLDRAPMVLYRQHGGNLIGAATGLAGATSRLLRLASGRWKSEMQAHAAALAANIHLLTPEAQATLAAFRTAPALGPPRAARLRALGVRRSSRAGTAVMLAAATLGLL
jgi:glycosyltransferase involved in cell wall biosynthesis